MRIIGLGSIAALTLCGGAAASQTAPQTLVAVFAHADDEISASPILARYAREGVNVYVIVATDGAQGGSNTTIPRGPELARARAEEMRCAAQALGVHPPILLEFPDGALGNYAADPTLLPRLTQRVATELARLRPDAIITWGPDGGTSHPDHRIISNIVTQLVRAGAPGVPERLFYSAIPAEGFPAMNPSRTAPPLLIPQAKYFSMRVPFTPGDLDAAVRAMGCHRTQYSGEVVQRVSAAMKQVFNGVMPLAPWFSTAAGTDIFAKGSP